MFSDNVLKYLACIVVMFHIFMCNTNSILAATSQLLVANSEFFAQTPDPETIEKGNALRESYNEKINSLMREVDSTKVFGKSLLNAGILSLFWGANLVYIGKNTVKDAIKEIPGDDPEFQKEKEDALKALNSFDSFKSAGEGIMAIGGISLLGYVITRKLTEKKQERIEALRSELDIRLEKMDLLPEYSTPNESKAAVLKKIDDVKKSASSTRTIQSLFSRLAIGCIVSAGVLVVLSNLTQDVVETIDIDQNDFEQLAARDDALDEADNMKKIGYGLFGAYIICGLAYNISGQLAGKKDKEVEELEKSLLRIAEGINIQPKPNGFMITYTYKF